MFKSRNSKNESHSGNMGKSPKSNKTPIIYSPRSD